MILNTVLGKPVIHLLAWESSYGKDSNYLNHPTSKVTAPQGAKVSAAGLLWLEHFRHTKVKSLLVGLGKVLLSPQDLAFVLPIYLKYKALELRVCGFLKIFTLKGGARHQFVNVNS